MSRLIAYAAAVAVLTLAIVMSAPIGASAAPDPWPPASPVKLIFIHHSTGEAWLDDAHGGLGKALAANNYFVSDTNYGWGPDAIGDHTDIGNWWTWFRGTSSDNYLTALFAENGQHCSYSRLPDAPAGLNQIVLFKSCFPNSALRGSPTAAIPDIASNPLKGQDSGSDYHTVANAKGIYNDLLPYFDAHPETLFVAICAPPLSDPTYSANARAFNNWLVTGWLSGYSRGNVFVFDFYDVLTTNAGDANHNDLGLSRGNHHRLWNGIIQHITTRDDDSRPDVLEYATSSGDDHPRAAGDRKATEEFVPLLNVAYNAWKGNESTRTPHPPVPYAPWRAAVRRGGTAALYYKVADPDSRIAFVSIVLKNSRGRSMKWITPGAQPTGRLLRAGSKITLPAGTYRFYVYATDHIGIHQSRVASNRLTVR
jgi:hypothetical protein